MGKPKMKIKVGNLKRLLAVILILIIVIAAIIWIVIRAGRNDPVVKQIEQQENQQISLKDIQIKAYVGEAEKTDTTVSAETQIDFKAVYIYSLESEFLENYFVNDNITIKVSDPAVATVVNDSSIVISNAMSSDTEFTVTVTYDNSVKKYTQEFKFTYVAAPAPEQ